MEYLEGIRLAGYFPSLTSKQLPGHTHVELRFQHEAIDVHRSTLDCPNNDESIRNDGDAPTLREVTIH